MEPEDRALAVGAVVGILGVLGSVLSGDARYATVGTLILGLGALLKSALGR